MTSETPLLEGAELAAMRGERLIFANVDFAVGAGEALTLTGRNGAGKSTLMRIIAGLARPFAGEVRWRGEPALTDREGFAGATGLFRLQPDGLAQHGLAVLEVAKGSVREIDPTPTRFVDELAEDPFYQAGPPFSDGDLFGQGAPAPGAGPAPSVGSRPNVGALPGEGPVPPNRRQPGGEPRVDDQLDPFLAQ